ncbi:hypothetical protein SprV_0200630900 [Sparganum proliferum]
MDDERPPARIFYGDVATGSRRKGGQDRRYKSTLKTSLQSLQIRMSNWEGLACDRPAWRKIIKAGAAVFETNRITDTKAKRKAQISTAAAPAASKRQRPTVSNLNFLDSSGSAALIFFAPSTYPWPSTPSTNVDHPPGSPPLPSSISSFSSSTTTTSTSATVASAIPIKHAHKPETPTNANTATVDTNNRYPVYTCPQCDRTFTPHIGLVKLLRIHRTETGEQVPAAPTYTRRICLHCPHCTVTFINRMGLLGHMGVNENLR